MNANDFVREAIEKSGLSQAEVATKYMGWKNRQDISQKLRRDCMKATEAIDMLDRIGWSVVAINRLTKDVVCARPIEGYEVKLTKKKTHTEPESEQ